MTLQIEGEHLTADQWLFRAYNYNSNHVTLSGLERNHYDYDKETRKSIKITDYRHPLVNDLIPATGRNQATIKIPVLESNPWHDEILKSKESYLEFVSKWKALWKFVAAEIRNRRTNRRILKLVGLRLLAAMLMWRR